MPAAALGRRLREFRSLFSPLLRDCWSLLLRSPERTLTRPRKALSFSLSHSFSLCWTRSTSGRAVRPGTACPWSLEVPEGISKPREEPVRSRERRSKSLLAGECAGGRDEARGGRVGVGGSVRVLGRSRERLRLVLSESLEGGAGLLRRRFMSR